MNETTHGRRETRGQRSTKPCLSCSGLMTFQAVKIGSLLVTPTSFPSLTSQRNIVSSINGNKTRTTFQNNEFRLYISRRVHEEEAINLQEYSNTYAEELIYRERNYMKNSMIQIKLDFYKNFNSDFRNRCVLIVCMITKQ